MSHRSPNQPFADENGPVILAHRGWRGLYPENTMLAFEKAAELPIDGLEIDIHSTADDVPVVIHDATVDRTTNGSGPVHDFTLAELKKLDAGYRWTNDDGKSYPFRGRSITIPTLAEVFEAFPHLWINVDIKQESPSMVKLFADTIRQHNMIDKMCVGSFSDKNVADFRKELPEVAKSGSAWEVRRLFIMKTLQLSRLYWGGANVMQIPEYEGNIHLVTKRFVKAAHRNGIAVHVWTVNETAVMQHLLNIGVDGLVTDFPDRALKLVGRL
ncbi:MAG: glycerophosphodiester phosphodiesterase [Chloroflexi bacterium]|nr:MAG: glycerophosphodiester phosphodiesterase [Chloroflexota bacterium]